MRSKLSSISRNAGISLCALGGYILFGWIIGNEPMVRVAPGSPAMAINTAAMFLVCGICLLCAHSTKEIPRRLFRALPFVLILAPCAILVQHIFGIDLGIDWASVHAALGDGHAKPGRTAPNACLGFLFAGIVFVLTRSRAPGRITHRINSVLASIVLVIGITAFFGYLFDLEALYQIASYNKMAALTALGMTALGAGIWSLQAQFSRVARAAAQPDVGHVTLLAHIADRFCRSDRTCGLRHTQEQL